MRESSRIRSSSENRWLVESGAGSDLNSFLNCSGEKQ